ncbi:MAG: hypothetical protein WCT52_01730 [Candidatus Micrarchaeia archaeon]
MSGAKNDFGECGLPVEKLLYAPGSKADLSKCASPGSRHSERIA